MGFSARRETENDEPHPSQLLPVLVILQENVATIRDVLRNMVMLRSDVGAEQPVFGATNVALRVDSPSAFHCSTINVAVSPVDWPRLAFTSMTTNPCATYDGSRGKDAIRIS
jgi:hypothetical protein